MANRATGIWMKMIYIQVLLGHMNLFRLSAGSGRLAIITLVSNCIMCMFFTTYAVLVTTSRHIDIFSINEFAHQLLFLTWSWMVALEAISMLYNCIRVRQLKELHNKMTHYLTYIEKQYPYS